MSTNPSIDVVTICSKNHADVWKLTSSLLPIFVKANSYTVYVPQTEISFFKSITNSCIEVRSQQALGIEFNQTLKERIASSTNTKRLGWYLQQFYKIEALRRSNSEIVAIWDADCVPVKEIEMIDELDNVVYVESSREYHADYFHNIERLLGMKRIQELSFVIPGFPMRNIWLKEFILFIEQRHRTYWYEAVMNTTNFDLQSGFSETETLGTWVANSYPGKWKSRSGSWERFGQSRFGYAKNFKPEDVISLGNKFDLEIISFENWDVRGPKWALGAFRRIWSKFLK